MDAPPVLSLDLLHELEKRWRRQQAPVLDCLRPGLSVGELDGLMAPVGLRLPAEAHVWWGWHDGADAGPGTLARDRQIGGPGFQFLPLAEAIEQYERNRRIAEAVADRMPESPADLADPWRWWDPGGFPITVSAAGAVVMCDTTVPQGAVAPIRARLAGEPATAGARSFGEMVNWWIEALDSAAWRFDTHTLVIGTTTTTAWTQRESSPASSDATQGRSISLPSSAVTPNATHLRFRVIR